MIAIANIARQLSLSAKEVDLEGFAVDFGRTFPEIAGRHARLDEDELVLAGEIADSHRI